MKTITTIIATASALLAGVVIGNLITENYISNRVERIEDENVFLMEHIDFMIEANKKYYNDVHEYIWDKYEEELGDTIDESTEYDDYYRLFFEEPYVLSDK